MNNKKKKVDKILMKIQSYECTISVISLTPQQVWHVKCKGQRYKIFGFVQEIYDCVGECHRYKWVIDFYAIVEEANKNSTNTEVEICMHFCKIAIVM
jgi:hypothetical protein